MGIWSMGEGIHANGNGRRQALMLESAGGVQLSFCVWLHYDMKEGDELESHLRK